MQFECSQCHKPLNLPDAKLPVGKPFSFTCPYCKMKNTATIPAEESAPLPPAPPEEEAAANETEYHTPPAPPAPLRVADDTPPPAHVDDETEDPNEAADDRPKALIVYDDPEVAERLVQKLEEMGHRGHIAMNMRDAARQMKFIKFRIMIIQEDYFGSSLSGNHLLRSIQGVDNHVRRGTLVVLISPSLASLDDLTAFALSVDAIVNTNDIEQINQLLTSSIAQAQKLYSVYEEVLLEEGLN